MGTLIWPTVVAFAVCLAVGPLAISALRKLKFGQNIRQDGPQTHIAKKGTPTMGGVIILAGAVVAVAVFVRYWNSTMIMAMVALLGFGFIGFLDDFISITKKRSMGLKAWQKSGLQLLLSCGIAWYAYQHVGTVLLVPFTTWQWNVGLWYLPMAVLALVGMTNSVNLTDGVDGLAGGISLIFFASFALLFTVMIFPDNLSLSVLCGSMAGACLGYLRFNVYPARVFMGDTGALALGGLAAYVALVSKTMLWLFLFGGVFMAASISVIIQVTSYKLRKKRVFKMAPLQHHFELMGIPETRIVALYMIVTAVMCLVGLAAFKP